MLLVAPRTNPERGVGVDTLGEVGMIADADQVEAGVVGEAGMPEHLAHLADAALQPEAEEDFMVGGRDGGGVHEVLLNGHRGDLVESSITVHCS